MFDEFELGDLKRFMDASNAVKRRASLYADRQRFLIPPPEDKEMPMASLTHAGRLETNDDDSTADPKPSRARARRLGRVDYRRCCKWIEDEENDVESLTIGEIVAKLESLIDKPVPSQTVREMLKLEEKTCAVPRRRTVSAKGTTARDCFRAMAAFADELEAILGQPVMSDALRNIVGGFRKGDTRNAHADLMDYLAEDDDSDGSSI